MDPEEHQQYKMTKLRDLAKELGFNSLFDVALAEAKLGGKTPSEYSIRKEGSMSL
jgi:hypothetical protein